MAEAFYLLDENSGFVAEVPVIIPLRWRNKITSSSWLTGAGFDIPTNSTTPSLCGSSSSVGAWNDGGTASIGRNFCLYQNGSAFIIRKSFAIMYRPFASWSHVDIGTTTVAVLTDTTIEIDWEAAMALVRATHNPKFYAIGAVRFTDSGGNNPVDLVKEGLVNMEEINGTYQDTKHEGEVVAKDVFTLSSKLGYDDLVTPYGPAYPNDETIFRRLDLNNTNIKGVTTDEAGANFPTTVRNCAVNTCVTNSRNVPMYLKVWVKSIVAGSGAGASNPEKTQQDNGTDGDPEDRLSQSGSGISGSGLGSGGQGMNRTNTMYGNSNLPFDSVFLTGDNYNSFISAGGGLVTESGVFPNSTAIYIDKVRLSVEGSTMSVVEVVKFDATPSLTIGQKIFGYVFDDTHQSKPVFTGYVISRRRKLNSNTQEITYECRDLSYYFGQFYSPSFYFYRPPQIGGSTQKSYDRVLKEILNVAGIPDAVVSLPDTPAPPIEWVYEPLSNILEWSTKYFGKYVSYVDRYGRLNVRATDSGSFIKNIAIPVEGVPVGAGDYKVMDTEPITDNSRSRSRLLLTGDFELKERVSTIRTHSRGPVNPGSNPSTGFYWYYKTISIYGTSRFFYFVFRTNDQMLDKLLSDPQKNAVVKMSYTSQLSGIGISGTITQTTEVELPIVFFDAGASGGTIIAELDRTAFGTGTIVPSEFVTSPYQAGGGQVTGQTNYTFTVRHAVKERSPIQVALDTGLTGGVEVIKRPEFKKVSGSDITSVDDTPLMEQYLDEIKEFYKPVSGGRLQKDSLDLDLELLGKVSISGTSLPASEASSLTIYEIEYDVPKKITTVELSNRIYEDLPFFDVIRERSRGANESLVKIGLLEQSALYNQQ